MRYGDKYTSTINITRARKKLLCFALSRIKLESIVNRLTGCRRSGAQAQRLRAPLTARCAIVPASEKVNNVICELAIQSMPSVHYKSVRPIPAIDKTQTAAPSTRYFMARQLSNRFRINEMEISVFVTTIAFQWFPLWLWPDTLCSCNLYAGVAQQIESITMPGRFRRFGLCDSVCLA